MCSLRTVFFVIKQSLIYVRHTSRSLIFTEKSALSEAKSSSNSHLVMNSIYQVNLLLANKLRTCSLYQTLFRVSYGT